MALKVIEGVISDLGPATPLSAADGPTGTRWDFLSFSRAGRKPVTLANVVADKALGACITPQQAGRFAFYPHDGQLVLCGLAGGAWLLIGAATNDPAVAATEAVRLPAKRKIFWGIVMIPTIIGLFFAFDIIKAGRAVLRENPAPKRPSDKRLTRALKGQLYWPF